VGPVPRLDKFENLGFKRKNQGLFHKVEGHGCEFRKLEVLFAKLQRQPAEGLRECHVADRDWLALTQA
jgi:hypothetical protein